MSNEMQAGAVRAFLERLLVGQHEFSETMDETEQLALLHAEHVAARGYARQLPPRAGKGPRFEITDMGRAAIGG